MFWSRVHKIGGYLIKTTNKYIESKGKEWYTQIDRRVNSGNGGETMSIQLKSPITEARRIIEEFGLYEIPIDVEGLCKTLGIALCYVNLERIEKKVGRKISGLIQKHPDGRCQILVNENDIATRIRFTIAHELGHYFLHMESEPTGVITSFRGDRSYRETEANKFAAELLMPIDKLEEEYSKLVIPIAETLAEIFNVSKQAMQVRLSGLEMMHV